MWKTLFIPDDILKAVEELGFDEPTPIQQQVLPIALRDYVDILGSAPTVSFFGNFKFHCFGSAFRAKGIKQLLSIFNGLNRNLILAKLPVENSLSLL